MYPKCLNALVASCVIVSYVLLLAVPGYAEGPSVKLIVNPNKTDVYVGSDPTALTAKASGTGLKFAWKLQGPGRIEGSGSAIFYHIPESVDGKSAQALITVTVTDDAGQETTETFTFNILAKETATTPATPAEPKKEGMSTTTKIAIGAGAAVLVGGAIALASSGGSDDNKLPFELGLWNLTFDWSCDGNPGSTTWNFKDDKTFEDSGGYYGTWAVNGKQITVTYSNGTRYSGTIDSAGTYMYGTITDVDGGGGCWDANYIGTGAKATSVVAGDEISDAAGNSLD